MGQELLLAARAESTQALKGKWPEPIRNHQSAKRPIAAQNREGAEGLGGGWKSGSGEQKQGKRREKVRKAVTGRRESCQGQRRDSHSYKQRSGKEEKEERK